MLFVNIVFGLNTPITKTLMPEYLTSLSLNYLRIGGACILFWFESFFIKEKQMTSKDIILLCLAGMFGIVINQFSFVKGL